MLENVWNRNYDLIEWLYDSSDNINVEKEESIFVYICRYSFNSWNSAFIIRS